MGSSGTRQTNERGGVLTARAILALFVAWGSTVEMTRELVWPLTVPVAVYWPGKASS